MNIDKINKVKEYYLLKNTKNNKNLKKNTPFFTNIMNKLDKSEDRSVRP